MKKVEHEESRTCRDAGFHLIEKPDVNKTTIFYPGNQLQLGMLRLAER